MEKGLLPSPPEPLRGAYFQVWPETISTDLAPEKGALRAPPCLPPEPPQRACKGMLLASWNGETLLPVLSHQPLPLWQKTCGAPTLTHPFTPGFHLRDPHTPLPSPGPWGVFPADCGLLSLAVGLCAMGGISLLTFLTAESRLRSSQQSAPLPGPPSTGALGCSCPQPPIPVSHIG